MVGTLDDGLRTLAKKRDLTAGLDPYDRALVGGSVRLDIPFTDPIAMRRVGELLCALGERMKHYSARGDLTDFAILMALKGEVLAARRKILEANNKKMRGSVLVELSDLDR